jgi:hypothetical protein
MWFLKVVVASCFGFLALLCAAVIAGKAQPVVDPLPELQICSSGPCYLGIAPGKTTLDEAGKIIADTPYLQIQQPFYTAQYAGKQSEPAYLVSYEAICDMGPCNHPNPPVTQLGLSFPDKAGSINASAIIYKFGVPCTVIRQGPGNVILAYPGMNVFSSVDIQGDAATLRPYSPIRHINIAYIVISPGRCEQLRNCTSCVRWHGFGKYREG